MNDDEKIKTLDRAGAEQLLNKWIAEFILKQPSDYFNEHPTDDVNLSSYV